MEGQYLADVAKRRWPVLVFVFSFDVGCYLLRLGAKLLSGHQGVTPVGLIHNLSPQLANMAFCYLFLTYVNRRSRRLGNKAARQVRCCARQLLVDGVPSACPAAVGNQPLLSWVHTACSMPG